MFKINISLIAFTLSYIKLRKTVNSKNLCFNVLILVGELYFRTKEILSYFPKERVFLELQMSMGGDYR